MFLNPLNVRFTSFVSPCPVLAATPSVRVIILNEPVLAEVLGPPIILPFVEIAFWADDTTAIFPIKLCISSDELPKLVEPDNVATVILVTEEDIMYSLAVREPKIVTLSPLKDIGRRLPVPSARLVPSVWTTHLP